MRKRNCDGQLLERLPEPRDFVRFFKKAKVDKETGCWDWKGAKSSKGYGWFWFAGRSHVASRWIKLAVHGALPHGKQAHHEDVCRNPGCVNPYHIQGLSVRENTADGNRHRKPKEEIPF
jgi:hypothetical protein